MKRSQFTEKQIMGILREAETGVATADVCRSPASRRPVLQVEGQVRQDGRVGGRRPTVLEDEKAKLKRLLAKAMPDNAILKDIAAKEL
jgi:putative transposase